MGMFLFTAGETQKSRRKNASVRKKMWWYVFTLIEFLSDSTCLKHYVVHWKDTSSPIWYRRLSDNVIQNEEYDKKVSSLRSRFIVKFSGISSRHIRENSFLRNLNKWGSKSSQHIISSNLQFRLPLLSVPSGCPCAFMKFKSKNTE